MRRGVLTIALIAAVLAGCAGHRAPRGADGRPTRPPDGSHEAGAIAANILYVPGRGAVCATSGLLAGLVMLITSGHAYDSASELMHGGCSGPWILEPEDVQ